MPPPADKASHLILLLKGKPLDREHRDCVYAVIPALYHENWRHFYFQSVSHVCVLSPAAVDQGCEENSQTVASPPPLPPRCFLPVLVIRKKVS